MVIALDTIPFAWATILLFFGSIPFLVVLGMVYWRLRHSATQKQPSSKTSFHLATLGAGVIVSVLFGFASAWYYSYLASYGPSSGNTSYLGNGALGVFYTVAIGAIGGIIIPLVFRAWWATLVVPLVMIGAFLLGTTFIHVSPPIR